MDFERKINKINALEDEILSKSSSLMKDGQGIYSTDLFVLGAVKRVLSTSAGFRTLMTSRNFTCAAALLRMQIDTAARINALRHVKDLDSVARAVLSGSRFDKQKSIEGKNLSDFYIVSKLNENFPWVSNVYKETSGFVHLSERHFYASVAKKDDDTRSVYISIGVDDPDRPDEAYFEILDAFFEANKMAGLIILGYITSRSKQAGS